MGKHAIGNGLSNESKMAVIDHHSSDHLNYAFFRTWSSNSTLTFFRHTRMYIDGKNILPKWTLQFFTILRPVSPLKRDVVAGLWAEEVCFTSKYETDGSPELPKNNTATSVAQNGLGATSVTR